MLELSSVRGNRSPLHSAVEQNNIEEINRLLAAGEDINCLDEHGLTPLATAALKGYLGPAKVLLSRGAIQCIAALPTPLHLAAQYGHLALMILLIEYGAAIDANDDNGATPLYRAAQYRQYDAAAKLISCYADVNARGDNTWSPLHVAAFNDDLMMVKLLAANGAEIDVRDGHGKTPLSLAAFWSQDRTAVPETLLAHGADPTLVDDRNCSPLDIARHEAQIEVYGLMRDWIDR